MSKFKAGDKVECIGMDPGYRTQLTINKIYTVKTIYYDNWIKVNEINAWFEVKYFELVKEKHYKWDIQIHTIEAKLYPNGHYEEHKKEWKISDHYVSEDKINDYINQYFIPQYECQILEFHKIESSFKEE